MNWGAILGMTFIVAFILLYEWQTLRQLKQKDKFAFLSLLSMGWLLGIVLVFYPDLPSPAKLMEALFGPLGKILE
ncbi:hypothetical protein [Ammoniphilus sp. YIM 78166]|uniref:hypothetical protein n=1 Tax=Ammoniphilus sp. YIM 78166 TaxID=1644106 RepID=UPI0010702C64|nr:hypothetical protein [Ammoniphilus sp. YIM 78166]